MRDTSYSEHPLAIEYQVDRQRSAPTLLLVLN